MSDHWGVVYRLDQYVPSWCPVCLAGGQAYLGRLVWDLLILHQGLFTGPRLLWRRRGTWLRGTFVVGLSSVSSDIVKEKFQTKFFGVTMSEPPQGTRSKATQ